MDEVKQDEHQVELEMKDIVLEKFPAERRRVPILDCYPNWYNPNKQNEKIMKKVRANIEKLGAIDPIHVRKGRVEGKYEIIDGEHRWKIMVALGYKQIDVDYLGEIDDATAQRLTINLNRLRGTDDIHKRAKVLKEMRDRGDDLMLLPFEQKHIDEEIELTEFDFSVYDKPKISAKEESPYAALIKSAINLENKVSQILIYIEDDSVAKLMQQYLEWVVAVKKTIVIGKKQEIIDGQVPMFKVEEAPAEKPETGDK